MNIPVSFPFDSQGYLSQECPECERQFKVRFGQGSEQPLSFCPYCGHEGRNCWWTTEQAEHVAALAREKVVSPLMDDFARRLQRLNRPGGMLRVSVRRSATPRAVAPVEPEEELQEHFFPCCGERIRHEESAGGLFCVICGAAAAA